MSYATVKCSSQTCLTIPQKTHFMSFPNYKEMFPDNLDLVETVVHKCGICGELILLDQRRLRTHLRRVDHRKNTGKYCQEFMVDTRTQNNEPKKPMEQCEQCGKYVKKERLGIHIRRFHYYYRRQCCQPSEFIWFVVEKAWIIQYSNYNIYLCGMRCHWDCLACASSWWSENFYIDRMTATERQG